jgi:hypothetical protein
VGARPLADAQQGRRQLLTAAAQGSHYRAGPMAGTVGRDAALRASWAPTIVMTAPMRMSSSGSAGKLAAAGG